MAFKARGGTLNDFPNKKQLMLTFEVIMSHLEGAQTIGIYPLLEDNTSHFIIADFDKENWQEESKAFLKICQEQKLPAYIERSRSGNGAHVWIFFEEKYLAQKSRSIVLELLRKALNVSEFEKDISFDRLFPNQDYHSNKGFGNLIALPLQGKSLAAGNTTFLNPETFEVVTQWEYLKTFQKVTAVQLDELYGKLVKGEDDDEIKDKKSVVSKTTGLTLILNNEIKIKKIWLTPRIVKYLREHLNFFNTEYLIKQKMGISTYQTEKYFKLMRDDEEYVHLPRGFLQPLIMFFKEKKIKYTITDERETRRIIPFTSKINLYAYQQIALDERQVNGSSRILRNSIHSENEYFIRNILRGI